MSEIFYDYEIQAYINPKNGDRVMGCFHPFAMRASGPCCNANRFCGFTHEAALSQVRKERALDNIERIGRGARRA